MLTLSVEHAERNFRVAARNSRANPSRKNDVNFANAELTLMHARGIHVCCDHA